MCARRATSPPGDLISEIVASCLLDGAWRHIDGAFGLWVAASPARRASSRPRWRADSWTTDGAKWLNVPYDCGTRRRGW